MEEVNNKVLRSAGFRGVYELISFDYENVQDKGGLAGAWGLNSDNIDIDDIDRVESIEKWTEGSKRIGAYQNVSCRLVLKDNSIVTWYMSFYLD